MDENTPHRPPTSTHTTINHTGAKPKGGGGVMWFLLGGLVVVVAIIAYFVLGDGVMSRSAAPAPSGGDATINIESSDAPASETAPATETAPADATSDEAAPPAD